MCVCVCVQIAIEPQHTQPRVWPVVLALPFPTYLLPLQVQPSTGFLPAPTERTLTLEPTTQTHTPPEAQTAPASTTTQSHSILHPLDRSAPANHWQINTHDYTKDPVPTDESTPPTLPNVQFLSWPTITNILSTPYRPQSLPLNTQPTTRREQVQQWIIQHTPQNTINTYRPQISQFNKWCAREGVPSYPATPDTLASYAIHMLEQEGKSRNTISTAVSAITSQYRLTDESNPGDHPLTKATVKTVAKVTPPPKRRKPLTVELVLRMVEKAARTTLLPQHTANSSLSSTSSASTPSTASSSSASTSEHERARQTVLAIGAPITSQALLGRLRTTQLPSGLKIPAIETRDIFLIILSMAGFLRESETVALEENDVHLENVIVDDKETPALLVLVEKSKMDQTRRGHTIAIGKGTIPAVCPHAWFERYMATRSKTAKSFFYNSRNGEPLKSKTPNHIIKNWLRKIGVDPKGFGSHSARSGGASAAAAKGVEERLIKRHGNWRSDAVYLYIREPWDSLLSVSVF